MTKANDLLKAGSRTTRARSKAASDLLLIAHRYDTAAGHAFAQQRDDEATKYREAASKLRALSNELPALPVRTR